MSPTSILPASFERLRDLHPAGAAALERMLEEAWQATDPDVLARCRLEIRTGLGSGLRPDPASDDPYVALTEQFVRSVSGVTDDQIQALRRLGDDGSVYAFVAALYVVDMTERLDLLARATFARATTPLPEAAMAGGSPRIVGAPSICALSVGPRIDIPGGGMSVGIPLDHAMDAFAAAAMRAE